MYIHFGMFTWLTGIQNLTCMTRVSICVGKVALRLLVWVQSRWEWSGAYNNMVSFWKVTKYKVFCWGVAGKLKKNIAFCFAAALPPVNLFLIELIRFLFLSRPRRYGAGMSATNNFDFCFFLRGQCMQIADTSMSSWYKAKHVQNLIGHILTVFWKYDNIVLDVCPALRKPSKVSAA